MLVRSTILVPLAAVCSASFALAAPTTGPTTALSPTTVPSLATLIDELGDRDPAVREQAQQSLMELSRNDLPALADAIRRHSLNPTQRSLLHDAVVHVYLTGKHDFTGDGSGYLGITQPAGSVAMMEVEEDEIAQDGNDSPNNNANGNGNKGNDPVVEARPTRRGAVVASRMVGYDGYRALQIGDVITAVARPDSGEADAGQFKRVAGFQQLRSRLITSHAGEWIVLRILRNGTEREVRVRLAPRPPDGSSGGVMSESPEGERYWNETFGPAMKDAMKDAVKGKSPATRPSH